MNTVEMAHGSGGQAMQQLINRLFMEAFNNPWLAEQEDQARIDLAALTAHGDRLAFSTDSYVIDPLFFPGGDIGKLAVCGTKPIDFTGHCGSQMPTTDEIVEKILSMKEGK